MEFVETKRFSRKRPSLMNDAEQRSLEMVLTSDPCAGDVIRGTGGFRKIRVRSRGRGKSGSLRVIYYFVTKRHQLLLYELFLKSDKDSLTMQEKNELKMVAATLK